jgi:tetratricopeptide (TPR) repeat protein
MATPGPGNIRLKSARQGLGLRSQQTLADAVTRTARSIGLRISVTARTVRRWESDNPPWPHPDHQAALEALFQRPITDLGFSPPWSDATSPIGDTSSDHQTTTAVIGGALTAFPSHSVVAILPASVVTDYIGITAAHRRLYYSVPASRLHEPVATHANLGAALLPAVPDRARPPLAAAVAESSLLAGRLKFFDLRQPEDAQRSFVIALQAAQEAGDPLLGSAILAHMAFIPAFSREKDRAGEARDKIRAARAFARRGPASPEMLAWLDAVEAEVETLFGDTRKALRLIAHAEDILSRGEKVPSPAWLDWFSADRLAGFKGNTLMIDGQYGLARSTLKQVLARSTDSEAKQRAVTLADLAAIAVAEGDPDEACALAESALESLARYWYATGMDRVRAVRQALTQWDSLPCVRQLDERLYDWNTTVNALSG